MIIAVAAGAESVVKTTASLPVRAHHRRRRDRLTESSDSEIDEPFSVDWDVKHALVIVIVVVTAVMSNETGAFESEAKLPDGTIETNTKT